MQHWMSQNQLLVVILAVLGFIVLWIFILNLIALASGWKRLAQRFRAQQEFGGAKWSWQSAQMRFRANYNNCLTVGGDQADLFLRPTGLFRVGHPALSIPWVEITAQPARVFFMPVVELRLGRVEQIPFRIRPVLAERLAGAAGPSWPGTPSLEKIKI